MYFFVFGKKTGFIPQNLGPHVFLVLVPPFPTFWVCALLEVILAPDESPPKSKLIRATIVTTKSFLGWVGWMGTFGLGSK